MSFTSLDIHPRLLPNLEAMGFHTPTPIQVKAIPPALDGRDILGAAETGTGKTAAFLLPALTWLLDTPRVRHPRILVLVPTRELALQVSEQATALSRGLPINVLTVYGGVGWGDQLNMLRRGADVVVATPGRLLDHFRRGTLRLDHIDVLVLDEADRMMDIGFMPDVRRIVRETPNDRQTLLFSATIAPIYGLARDMTRNPARVEVTKTVTPPAIEQSLFPVLEHKKAELLLHLLSDEDVSSALVFTRTKSRANRVSRDLIRAGVVAGVIHGDRSQGQRVQALEAFRHGRTRVLVATDIAARGIDVTGISHVVNYDVPSKAEDYVHRIGRTGRADRAGEAWTLVSPLEESMVDTIQRVVRKKIVRRSVSAVDTGRPVKTEATATASRDRVRDRGWTRPSRRRGRMR
jgi:ATP-dependent RNA helicase RhlE